MALDRVTGALLEQFSRENSLNDMPEDKRFAHFSAFAMIRRHFSRSFSTSDVVLGGGQDTGIDAIATIVNNVLVTDVDMVRELAAHNDYVEPTFVFVQSERNPHFDASKIGNFAFGVVDFFNKSPAMPSSEDVSALAQITDVILEEYVHILKPPRCYLYYVTTGQWQNDANLVARRDAAVADVRALNIFASPEMLCIGATELHSAYRRTRSPVSRKFLFDRRVEIPATEGVIQSAIGYLPFSEFKKLLADDSGTEMLTSIFEDNVRDWQGYKPVDSGIRETLLSEKKSKFVLMNNGVTIITRELTRVGDTFTITDYQIVNGCQSSNVLFEHRDQIDDRVMVPVRLVHTAEESIRELITIATNSQTDIKPDQFASSKNFARGLEQFFATYSDQYRLYYERRDGQYDRGTEMKLRVIDTATILRSYASIFKEVPQRTSRDYKSIRDEIGDKIFVEGDRHVAYYYAAYSWFLLEGYFRAKQIDRELKSARYHILMAVNLLIDNSPPPQRNSYQIQTRSEKALERLWDEVDALGPFGRAVGVIKEVTGGRLDRDHVRTEAITNAIISKLRPVPPLPAPVPASPDSPSV